MEIIKKKIKSKAKTWKKEHGDEFEQPGAFSLRDDQPLLPNPANKERSIKDKRDNVSRIRKPDNKTFVVESAIDEENVNKLIGPLNSTIIDNTANEGETTKERRPEDTFDHMLSPIPKPNDQTMESLSSKNGSCSSPNSPTIQQHNDHAGRNAHVMSTPENAAPSNPANTMECKSNQTYSKSTVVGTNCNNLDGAKPFITEPCGDQTFVIISLVDISHPPHINTGCPINQTYVKDTPDNNRGTEITQNKTFVKIPSNRTEASEHMGSKKPVMNETYVKEPQNDQHNCDTQMGEKAAHSHTTTQNPVSEPHVRESNTDQNTSDPVIAPIVEIPKDQTSIKNDGHSPLTARESTTETNKTEVRKDEITVYPDSMPPLVDNYDDDKTFVKNVSTIENIAPSRPAIQNRINGIKINRIAVDENNNCIVHTSKDESEGRSVKKCYPFGASRSKSIPIPVGVTKRRHYKARKDTPPVVISSDPEDEDKHGGGIPIVGEDAHTNQNKGGNQDNTVVVNSRKKEENASTAICSGTSEDNNAQGEEKEKENIRTNSDVTLSPDTYMNSSFPMIGEGGFYTNVFLKRFVAKNGYLPRSDGLRPKIVTCSSCTYGNPRLSNTWDVMVARHEKDVTDEQKYEDVFKRDEWRRKLRQGVCDKPSIYTTVDVIDVE